jgi:superfamily II DNA or RNA helicase
LNINDFERLDNFMDFEELLTKYNKLLNDNKLLIEENIFLRAKLGLSEDQDVNITELKNLEIQNDTMCEHEKCNDLLPEEQNEFKENEIGTVQTFRTQITNFSSPEEKIKLYMSLFRGRDDVYAKRYENDKTGKSGYIPACLNEWKRGICLKPKVSCNKCNKKDFGRLDESVVDKHLRGNRIVGIYPLSLDETCCFLAIDFDEGEWEKDISALREVALEFDLNLHVERSRSGKGAHVWFFFESDIPASIARRFGTALLTYAMDKRHKITFKSYDRLFPNQDTMPKGGFGNLIALPLQKEARDNGNSEFIDEKFVPYSDQWAYLASIKKFTCDEIEVLINKLCTGNELGILKIDEEDTEFKKPWEVISEGSKNMPKLSKEDFPKIVQIIKSNMLYIPKEGITNKALNRMKRLAAFKNPEFYKRQAMRLPTKDLPRIISCSDENDKYLYLPRGLENDVLMFFDGLKVETNFIDRTNCGKNINIEFNGHLRDDQPVALDKLLMHENGVLCGTTAFGKTVVAINLIAQRKVNTLILVDKVSLVAQWKKRISEFLTIKEELSEPEDKKKRGRKKERSIVGQLGAGKDNLSGVIDIAVMQSLNRGGEIKDCVRNYGMIIVDECHHVSAFTFENVLKYANSKYVYGLSATPNRKDGHHPIIFMQCGEIRFRDDAKKQAEKRPFEHYIIPRFTNLRAPLFKDEKDVTIHELYSEIVSNELRNQTILDDCIKSYEGGRNCILLTERTAHVEWFKKNLQGKISNLFSLIGSVGKKETKETLKRLAEIPENENIFIVATGKYVGEGFDEPRLDTLFLSMPISWKGTLQQYAGRLHRLFENKSEVQIYDYVDIHVRMLEKMYHKRLTGYASIGYKAKGESVGYDAIDIIFNKSNFLPVYTNDILNAQREILIVSPFISKKRIIHMLQYLDVAIKNQLRVMVVTRPIKDFKEKDSDILNQLHEFLSNSGIEIIFRSNIHQKFAIMDQKIVWYGSINLLSFGSSEESIMRLENSNIAFELLKSIES